MVELTKDSRVLLYITSGQPSKKEYDIIYFLTGIVKKGQLAIRNGQFFVNPEGGYDYVINLCKNEDIERSYDNIVSLKDFGYGVSKDTKKPLVETVVQEEPTVQSLEQEEVSQKGTVGRRGRKAKQ